MAGIRRAHKDPVQAKKSQDIPTAASRSQVIGPQTLPKPFFPAHLGLVLPSVSLLVSPTGVAVVATVASATRPLALGPTLSPCPRLLALVRPSVHRSLVDS